VHALPERVSTTEQTLIAAYRSRVSVAEGRGLRALGAADARLAPTTAGQDYFANFYRAYAADPDIKVLSAEITPTVLHKVSTPSATRYVVSMKVNFHLTTSLTTRSLRSARHSTTCLSRGHLFVQRGCQPSAR
jgi:hypothetical protein